MPQLTDPLAVTFLWAALGYLAGAVPFGVLITRALSLGDLRQIGSGNIGATNVLRTGSKAAALATLLLDGGKGAVVVLIARTFVGEGTVQIVALAAFLGHCYPVWLGFRGGKGVATFLGLLLAIAWPAGLAACATWAVVAALTRYASLASIVAGASAPLWALVLGRGEILLLCAILAPLIALRHAANITRLRAGTEPRIGRAA